LYNLNREAHDQNIEKKMKTVPIEFKQVVDSYQEVRRGGKAAGVDKESIEEFETDLENRLYLIHNRLCSGSYHPPAVRLVEIPKKDGKKRTLGIPTVSDKVAQNVVKRHLEKRLEPIFHEQSYGYRPLRGAKDALKQVRENCLQYDWVIDLDIKSFFDEIDHELLIKALEHIETEKWVILYVKRWLKAPMEKADGTKAARECGTPQGGVISPLLSNLYLHFVLDKWLAIHYPTISFVRYADDIVVHCRTQEEAASVLNAIKQRLTEVGLRVNDQKTQIVYCKDYRRKEFHAKILFNFLGFSFQPRGSISQRDHKPFVTFTPQISQEGQKKIRDEIRSIINRSNQRLELIEIAHLLNPKILGWTNYYGLFGPKKLRYVLSLIDQRLVVWIKVKHKCSFKKSRHMLSVIQSKNPFLFKHWNSLYGPKSYQTARAV
jgi:RNA-directed DNA polymerase